MGVGGANTDRAPSSKRVASKTPEVVSSLLSKPQLPLNDLVYRVCVVFSMAVVLETFVVLTAAQIIVGMLTKAFTYWVEMGAPGAY